MHIYACMQRMKRAWDLAQGTCIYIHIHIYVCMTCSAFLIKSVHVYGYSFMYTDIQIIQACDCARVPEFMFYAHK